MLQRQDQVHLNVSLDSRDDTVAWNCHHVLGRRLLNFDGNSEGDHFDRGEGFF
jgi:hypothetical protein